MMGIVAVVVCWLFAGGAFYFGRRLERDQGEGSVPTALKGVGTLMLVLGLARGGWMLVRNGGFQLPSFRRGGPPVSREELMTQCEAHAGLGISQVSASYCECAANAVDAARAVDPDFSTPANLSRYEGAPQGVAAFRAAFGRCANSRVRTWLSQECQRGCSAEGSSGATHGQQHAQGMACSRICRCVVNWGMQGQTAETVTDLFWSGGDTNQSPEVAMNNIVGRGLSHCQSQ